MPARIIYSCIVVFLKAIIDIIDEIITLVSKTGVFCLYTIWAGMDVLQSFFGGRLLSEPIFRPFSITQITQMKNIDYTDISGKKRAGAEVLSSGEEKKAKRSLSRCLRDFAATVVRPFVSICGWVRKSSISSGEEMRLLPTRLQISGLVRRFSRKFFGGRYLSAPCPARIKKRRYLL